MNLGFASRFGSDLTGMIELKVSLGGSENTYLSRAQNFDRFCAEEYPDAEELTADLAISWIKTAKGVASAVHSKIAFERGFATYLHSIGKSAHILPERFAGGKNIFVPYIFTDGELTALFRAIDAYQHPKDTFQPILLSTYFRLTYCCGLRPNEGRNLKRSDVDLNSGELRIINSKIKKSRLIVMSDDMLSLMKTYISLRDIAFSSSEYLFPSHNGISYSAPQMQNRFKHFFALANPDVPKEFLPPVRVYDLRHRFATAVLNKWLDQKQDINARLPYLQTYMGHKDLESTAYYIHMLPENLAKSAGVDWARLGQIFPRNELWGK